MIALQVVRTSFGFHFRECMGSCFTSPPPPPPCNWSKPSLTSLLPLAYLTTTGTDAIFIPSLVDTVAICSQKFLNWSSLHPREGAKQAKAQVSIRAPWWSTLLRMSHDPSRGTRAWSCGPSLILGAGSTRPSTLTISGSTEVWNSSFKYLLLVLIISSAYKMLFYYLYKLCHNEWFSMIRFNVQGTNFILGAGVGHACIYWRQYVYWGQDSNMYFRTFDTIIAINFLLFIYLAKWNTKGIHNGN